MADSGSGEGKVRRTGRSGGSGSCSPGVLLERRINKKKKEKLLVTQLLKMTNFVKLIRYKINKIYCIEIDNINIILMNIMGSSKIATKQVT